MGKMDVGGECEVRWRAEVKVALEQAKAEHFSRSDYLKLVSDVQAIPVSERKAWLRSHSAADHFDDVEFSLLTASGTPDEGIAPRFLTIQASRPYNRRKPIIAEVAAWASERYGATISIHTVERCWKFFRRVQTSIRDDEDAGNLNLPQM